MKTIYIPLKAKLIAIFLFVVVTTISIYLAISLGIFYTDKAAYVYSTALTEAENINKQTHMVLEKLKAEAWGFENLTETEAQIRLKANVDLKQIDYFEIAPTGITVLKSYYAPDEQRSTNNFSPEQVIKLKEFLIKDGKSINYISYSEEKKKGVSIWIKEDLLTRELNINSSFFVNILSTNGTNLLGPDLKRSFWKEIIDPSTPSEKVQTYQNEFLVASVKSDKHPLVICAEISVFKAFGVAKEILWKSLWLGVFVLSLGVIIGIFFARTLTKPIQSLVELTERVGQGDFSSQAQITSRDEIGILAKSFNHMIDQLLKYMEEMKEKLRLEKEVQVASLVQKCYIPEHLTIEGVEVGSFFRSASECGGDWWGVKTYGNKSVIFIADATGHGVPAALLTATAHACMSTLDILVEKAGPNIVTADKILEYFNHAIQSTGSEIFMTMNVAIIDHERQTLSIANASHLAPLYIHPTPGKEIDKSDLSPIMVEPGPRLGQGKDHQYQVVEQQISKDDVIILSTDGLSEKWGQRKYFKALIEHAANPAQIAVYNVIEGFDQFLAESKALQDDDITLIWIKVI